MSDVDGPGLVGQTVVRSLGLSVEAVHLVAVGKSNHVMRVETQEGPCLAVRVSKLGPARFEVERAVLDLVRGVVPVPAVHFVGDVPGMPGVAAMVTDWVDAPTVAEVLRHDPDARGELAVELAEVLARIHSIEVRGFGNLDSDMSGCATDFWDWFVEDVRFDSSSEIVAGSAPEFAGLPGRAAEVLARNAQVFEQPEARLAHGDFSPNNLLAAGTSVVAVLDWEAAKAGPPALDLGWLRFIDPERTIDQDSLVRAYANRAGRSATELVFASRLVEVRVLATVADWQARAGLTDQIPATMQRLSLALSQLDP